MPGRRSDRAGRTGPQALRDAAVHDALALLASLVAPLGRAAPPRGLLRAAAVGRCRAPHRAPASAEPPPGRGRRAYRALLRRAFDRADRPVRRTAAPGAAAWKRIARERGLAYDARPRELDVWDWVALFEARIPAATPRRRS